MRWYIKSLIAVCSTWALWIAVHAAELQLILLTGAGARIQSSAWRATSWLLLLVLAVWTPRWEALHHQEREGKRPHSWLANCWSQFSQPLNRSKLNQTKPHTVYFCTKQFTFTVLSLARVHNFTCVNVWMLGRLRWENVYVRNHFSTGENSARQEMRMRIEERSPGVGSLVELRLRPAAPSTGLQPTLSVMSLGGVSTSRCDFRIEMKTCVGHTEQTWQHWVGWVWPQKPTPALRSPPKTAFAHLAPALLHCCIAALLQFIEHILLIETFVMKTCFTTNLDPSGQETLRWWKYEHFKLRFQ